MSLIGFELTPDCMSAGKATQHLNPICDYDYEHLKPKEIFCGKEQPNYYLRTHANVSQFWIFISSKWAKRLIFEHDEKYGDY